MNKKTKMIVGIGVVAIAAYFILKPKKDGILNASGPKPNTPPSGPKPLGAYGNPKGSSTTPQSGPKPRGAYGNPKPPRGNYGYGSSTSYGYNSGYGPYGTGGSTIPNNPGGPKPPKPRRLGTNF